MKIYYADWVLPISDAPIPQGAILVEGNKIAAVGKLIELAKVYPHVPVKDFGEAAIIPGLVNAHAHLELTAMRGFLDSVEHDFSAWLLKLAGARDKCMTAECVANAALCGVIEAARAGVTCIADIGKHGFAGMMALRAVCLRGISYQENSFALNESEATEKFAEWRDKILLNRELETECVRVGATPHAPYTVSRRLFELITDFALGENLPISIHAAESKAERDFLFSGTGDIAQLIKKLDISWEPPQLSSIQYLNKIGALQSKPLLAHCVTVDERDVELIAETDARIAHCPKSNAKFGHGAAPLATFLGKGAAVGLGSDSVASNNSCDILEEARFAALLHRTRGDFVTAEEILQCATVGGARALNLEDKIGTLAAGKLADFTVISFADLSQQPIFDPVAAIVFSSTARDVIFTAVDGKTIYENGEVKTVDEKIALERLKETARRIVQ